MLSPEQKLAIEKGLKDVAGGRVYSSEDAQKMLREISSIAWTLSAIEDISHL